MSLCFPLSRPDMYGLGIRLSFYTQWFAALAFEHIGPESLPEIRLVGLLLSAGVTIGLVAQLVGGALDAAGVYVLLLLGTGSHLFLVPVYAWRALSCCSPYWNPLAWSREEQLRVFRVLNLVLVLTAASVGVWFFAAYLPGLDRGCRQFGFFFSQASLDHNEPFVAFNAALYVLVIVGCACPVCPPFMAVQRLVLLLTRQPSKEHVDGLRTLQSLSNLTVFAVLVAAVELSVRWNELAGAGGVDTSAQLIPLLVTAGIIVRVAYLHYVEDGDDESSAAWRPPSRPRPPSSDEGITWCDLTPEMEAYGIHMSDLPRRVPAVYRARGRWDWTPRHGPRNPSRVKEQRQPLLHALAQPQPRPRIPIRLPSRSPSRRNVLQGAVLQGQGQGQVQGPQAGPQGQREAGGRVCTTTTRPDASQLRAGHCADPVSRRSSSTRSTRFCTSRPRFPRRDAEQSRVADAPPAGSSEASTQPKTLPRARRALPPRPWMRPLTSLAVCSVKKYGLNMLVSADDQVKAYIRKIMSQLDKWMVGGQISKLVIVITDKDTGEHVERWQFDVQISQPAPKSKSKPPSPSSSTPRTADQENATPSLAAAAAAADKTEPEIQAEIAAIFRQITASVTFLPQLSGDCTFNVLVYADADSDVPVEWGDSDAKEIAGGEHVQLRGFSTASHRVDTLVSYRLGG
ncbi:Uncharacterized protein TPAR_05018 [Tolypocladium paradoxum]|uniref:HORMA domain-containing protein n=1 Tax=Tolypocladium paradoxum TaxID=94208 RepID=A0A2S4KXC4_9HYPO|nr:Uncharacterized protein TPAR_05018 [Tolypocladium paradoxum]